MVLVFVVGPVLAFWLVPGTSTGTPYDHSHDWSVPYQ